MAKECVNRLTNWDGLFSIQKQYAFLHGLSNAMGFSVIVALNLIFSLLIEYTHVVCFPSTF